MDKIEFEDESGNKLNGYRCDYVDIRLGTNNQKCLTTNYWTVFELSTGLMINSAKNQPTRKQAIQKAINFIEEKGLPVVRNQIRDVLMDKHLGKGINRHSILTP